MSNKTITLYPVLLSTEHMFDLVFNRLSTRVQVLKWYHVILGITYKFTKLMEESGKLKYKRFFLMILLWKVLQDTPKIASAYFNVH